MVIISPCLTDKKELAIPGQTATGKELSNPLMAGLPKDIYKLINHNIEAKSIWDNVKMILAGSKLTKEDRESQLYDEFECFKMLPGENINEYYDMFVIAFKLNKGLKETNHEQLYAYLKQHEKHAAQDRLIIERITPTTNDQLAFVSSVQPYTQSSHVQSHQYPPSLAPLQSPHNVQGQQNQNQRNFARGNGTAGNGGAHNRAGNANACQGKPIKCYNCNGLGHIARNCTQPKRSWNFDYFKDKMLLMQAQENGAVLDEEELLFLAGRDVLHFDSDVDDEPTTKSHFLGQFVLSWMYVTETETDTYAISRVLAHMPIIICVAEMSFKREDAGLGNWEHLSITLFRKKTVEVVDDTGLLSYSDFRSLVTKDKVVTVMLLSRKSFRRVKIPVRAIAELALFLQRLKGIVLFSHRETSMPIPSIIAYMSNFECGGAFAVIIEGASRSKKAEEDTGQVWDLLDILLDISEDENMEMKLTTNSIKDQVFWCYTELAITNT
ncbi:retrovirus-related pol polyprotein from transposon TNT 1-94 [Tanacetum coccineum]